MESETLRLLIRAKLADGRLPHSAERRIWGRTGTGETPCAVCEEMITKDQFALEGAAPPDETREPFRLHAGCFQAWKEEQAAFRPGAANEETVRDRVRETLRHGGLTRIEGRRTWAGYGRGQPCHVCGEVIRRRDIEHEVVDTGGPILVHAACLRIWREESLTPVDATVPLIARILDLILEGPTCRTCINARLGMSPEVGKTVLAAIGKALVIDPAREPCARCGSTDNVISRLQAS